MALPYCLLGKEKLPLPLQFQASYIQSKEDKLHKLFMNKPEESDKMLK